MRTIDYTRALLAAGMMLALGALVSLALAHVMEQRAQLILWVCILFACNLFYLREQPRR